MSASAEKPVGGREEPGSPVDVDPRPDETGPRAEDERLDGSDVPPRASLVAARRSFVTVLFTDIVDSTRRAAEMGDHRWLELQAAHEAMATQALERFHGRVLRTTGDGLVATFGNAVSGVLCAARMVERSRQYGIALRAGLHAGECERHGRSMGGLVFHIGARIVELAGAEEILVSQTIPDLVVGSGLKFEPHGRHVLKGLDGKWTVYELRSREADVRTMG